MRVKAVVTLGPSATTSYPGPGPGPGKNLTMDALWLQLSLILHSILCSTRCYEGVKIIRLLNLGHSGYSYSRDR